MVLYVDGWMSAALLLQVSWWELTENRSKSITHNLDQVKPWDCT